MRVRAIDRRLVAAALFCALASCRRKDDRDIHADPSSSVTPRPPPAPSPPPFEWTKDEADARARAEKDARPMLLFFTADWSTACMEMRKNALTDPRVLEAARRFVGLLVDCTNEDDAPTCATLTKKYEVQGLPALVLLDARGEVAQTVVGMRDVDAIVTALEHVRP
jgi:thiol:disulfide interchange protein